MPSQLGWTKSVQFGGFFVAIEKGFFQQEGITADIKSGGPQIDAISIVAGGNALIGDQSTFTFIRARSKGVPIKAFAAIFQKSPFSVISLPAKPIKALKDFEGKKIALPPSSRPQVESLLKKGGVQMDKVEFVSVGVDPSLLTSGQVEGYFGYATNQGIILKERGVEVVITYTYDLGLKEYGNVIFATEASLSSQQELLVRWLRGAIKGFEYSVAHPEEVAKLMVDKYGMQGLDLKQQSSESRAQVELLQSPLTQKKGLLWIDPDVWQQSLNIATDFGATTNPVTVNDLMTTEVLEKAYGGRNKLLDS